MASVGYNSIYPQYRRTGVYNDEYVHISVVLLMQYIAEYCSISQCGTIGLNTQGGYASTILKYCSSITHNTHVSGAGHCFSALMQY